MFNDLTLRRYLLIVLVLFALKNLLAFWFPVTGDEAYFLVWGNHLDYGYYDHPPMVGWVVYLFSFLGEHVYFARLFAVVTSTAIGLIIYAVLARVTGDRPRSMLASLIYFFSPIYLANTLILTDTPLIFFVFLAGVTFFYAWSRDSMRLMLLTGILLGLGFLSKYFAVFLGVAMVVFFLFNRRRAIPSLGLILLGSAPSVLLHLWWNYNNCDINILFNLYFRSRSGIRLDELSAFAAYVLYLTTPWVIYFLITRRRSISRRLKTSPFKVFPYFFLVPLLILWLLSFQNTGLHWLFAFYPFLYPFLAFMNPDDLQRLLRWSVPFMAIHYALIIVLLALPVNLLKDYDDFADVILFTKGEKVCEYLDQYTDDYVLAASTGYTTASGLAYHCRRYFPVFLGHSKHGRLDDKLTDYRDYDGRDFLIIGVKELDLEDYHPYFTKIEPRQVIIEDGVFHLLFGHGFDFASYRTHHLEKLRKKFYTIPPELPCNSCYFLEKYFPETSCSHSLFQ